ncbi:phosphatase PAP2 family protein [Flavobacterium sp.]|uniref:phosphatase PAP2 family protein n=1 Tax=Flavobacterium sp. TaxID=239 RepID=UPI0024872896|nr:phosphatase PAP2 family protein [Flavobacterium sp.]MDI1316579.1 phosphatase PAP2 family protein [Flavobacterium sp.]
MNTNVINNYSKLKSSLFFLPIFFLSLIVVVLSTQDALNTVNYVKIQKGTFFYINYNLGQYPNFIANLTQIGDTSIFFALLSIFIIKAPKLWEALLSSTIVAALFSCLLKTIFRVPRPHEVYDDSSFIIIGKKAIGFASLPSGHSITVFTTLTVLLFAFMPKMLKYKILWIFTIIILGLAIAFTRVGVGAHHPLDVIIGSIIGYISGLLGIFVIIKYKIFAWINNKKYYPIFIVLMLSCSISLIYKIMYENLVIYYLTLICLLISLYKITYVYLKKYFKNNSFRFINESA